MYQALGGADKRITRQHRRVTRPGGRSIVRWNKPRSQAPAYRRLVIRRLLRQPAGLAGLMSALTDMQDLEGAVTDVIEGHVARLGLPRAHGSGGCPGGGGDWAQRARMGISDFFLRDRGTPS
jgi:hypothetical protein